MAPEFMEIRNQLNRELNKFVHQLNFSDQSNLKKRISYEEFLSDKLLIIAAIRAGIPYSLFHQIQRYAPFSQNDWADLLNLSGKSMQRYRQEENHHFKPLHSEKIIEIAEVILAGLEVFGDMEKLKLWLNTPNFALGKLKPLELLRDSYGKELVLAELTRINYGILV
jgi:putative toxin-antitoxin system antitoxin component (TIGR02293 family)